MTNCKPVTPGSLPNHGMCISALGLQVAIVPHPAGVNAAVVRDSAPRLAPENITVLSRLAHNRLTQQVILLYSDPA